MHSWGNPKLTTYSTNNFSGYNPIRYRGYYYDVESGFYFLNARYYNPAWRRFISPDNTAYLDPDTPNGLNLYAYCNNNPVNYADPSGHISQALENGLKIGGAILISAALTVAAFTVASTTLSVILAGAAIGSVCGLVFGGVSSGLGSLVSGGSFIDGFATGALTGAITGGISGAIAASPIRVEGQIVLNALLSGASYTVTNYNNFNLGELLLCVAIGGLAGYAGGDGWMVQGSVLADELFFGGIKGLFIDIALKYPSIFIAPIVNSSVVGALTCVTEFLKRAKNKLKKLCFPQLQNYYFTFRRDIWSLS